VTRELVALLLERDAHHHIFSGICVGDLDLIRTLVEQNPELLDRRLSRFEQGLTPLHFAMRRKRYDILDLLIELGADIEAQDKSGQTALAVSPRIDRTDRAEITAAQDPRTAWLS
jgi:ankyrin repeat protein